MDVAYVLYITITLIIIVCFALNNSSLGWGHGSWLYPWFVICYVSTSATDWPESVISEMTCCVSSRTLKPADSVTDAWSFTSSADLYTSVEHSTVNSDALFTSHSPRCIEREQSIAVTLQSRRERFSKGTLLQQRSRSLSSTPSIHPSIHVYFSEKSNKTCATCINTNKIWVVQ